MLLLLACAGDPTAKNDPTDTAPDPVDPATLDGDGDGWLGADDCDDADPAVHPGAADPIDGVDEDCDGTAEGGSIEDLAELEVQGEHLVDNVGAALSFGDTDGDGLSDLAIGAGGVDASGPGGLCNGWGGAVYVARGARLGVYGASEMDGVILGDDQQISFGTDVAWVGANLLVGAPASYVEAPARLYLYEGPVLGAVEVDAAALQVRSEQPDEELGGAVDSAGDLDGDGIDDLLAGTPWGSHAGAIWVSGAERGELTVAEADGSWADPGDILAGFGVAGVGDVDADGYTDFVVSSVTASALVGESVGAVYLVRGPGRGGHVLAEADAVITGSHAHQELGYGLDGTADADGDGLPDLLLGAAEMDEAWPGSAWVVPGTVRGAWTVDQAAWASFTGEPDAGLGQHVAAGDLEADGTPDLLLGAPSTPDNTGTSVGAAHLSRGALPGSHPVAVQGWRLAGRESMELAGWDVAFGGDYDGDGIADLAIGAVGWGGYAGRAFVLSGAEYRGPATVD